MGHSFSSPIIDSMVVDYLRSLQKDGNGVYTVDEYQTEFNLNKLPGSDNAPKCHVFVKNTSIQCQDLNLDSQPLCVKSPKITIEIGEAVVRCDDLGYILRITGRITIFDVDITASFTPTFENGIQLSDIGSEATVNKIKGFSIRNFSVLATESGFAPGSPPITWDIRQLSTAMMKSKKRVELETKNALASSEKPSEIELHVNGTDHSRLANVLLSIDDPHIAGNLLNTAFILQKENLKHFMNEYIKEIASQFGL